MWNISWDGMCVCVCLTWHSPWVFVSLENLCQHDLSQWDLPKNNLAGLVTKWPLHKRPCAWSYLKLSCGGWELSMKWAMLFISLFESESPECCCMCRADLINGDFHSCLVAILQMSAAIRYKDRSWGLWKQRSALNQNLGHLANCVKIWIWWVPNPLGANLLVAGSSFRGNDHWGLMRVSDDREFVVSLLFKGPFQQPGVSTRETRYVSHQFWSSLLHRRSIDCERQSEQLEKQPKEEVSGRSRRLGVSQADASPRRLGKQDLGFHFRSTGSGNPQNGNSPK